MSLSLNIVSFDVPHPANYGGVIDVYYKLFWLKKAGVKIHLHCFQYGRKPSGQLADLCEKVYYYKRKTGWKSLLSLLPYTVISRRSARLEENLLQNDYPILFEVLHTCYLLNDQRFASRKKIYRHSNIEHDYYKGLASAERNYFKKLFLISEAWKLKRFEKIISNAQLILAVNLKDADYFKKNYPRVKSVYLPSFHQNESCTVKEGTGSYVLFNGNLSVAENSEAVAWLVKNVFSRIAYPVKIAGLNPPLFLTEIISPYSNISLIADPAEQEMHKLIANAQIHVLWTKQATGLKLKLLNVLFSGRFVILNKNMLAGTGLVADDTLYECENADQFIAAIEKCYSQKMSTWQIEARAQQIKVFDNQINVTKLIKLIEEE